MKLARLHTVSVVLLFLIALSARLPAQGSDVSLFLRLENMSGEEAPSILANDILFGFRPRRATRSVGVAFGHEDYRTVHRMRLNRSEIFFLLYPRAAIPADVTTVEYRLVVDGIWMGDPNNPLTRYATNGAALSQLRLPARALSLEAPLQEAGSVEFLFVPLDRRQSNLFGVDGERLYFEVTSGLEVSVAGSFNNWDPFLQPLREQEDQPGSYRVRLSLPAGRYEYYYVVNGQKVLDPHNPMVGVNRVGRRASILIVAQQ